MLFILVFDWVVFIVVIFFEYIWDIYIGYDKVSGFLLIYGKLKYRFIGKVIYVVSWFNIKIKMVDFYVLWEECDLIFIGLLIFFLYWNVSLKCGNVMFLFIVLSR